MDYKVHKCELRYASKTARLNEYVNEVTKFMDTHNTLMKNSKYGEDSTYKFMNTTYLMDPELFNDATVITFRVPGATRGCIVVDKVDVDGTVGYKIKEFRFIETTCFSAAIGCFERDIIEAVKKFIGDVIVF